MKKIMRQELENFEPYKPGKPISEVKRELGLVNVIKLASNENPLGPSKKAVTAICKAAKNSFLYPDGGSYELRKKIADKFDLDINCIIMGSGTDEIIELIGKAFFNKSDNIVISEHAFIRYKMAADLMGCKTIEVPMKDFTHDLYAMATKVNNKTKAVFIANPNNPTGTYNSKNEVEKCITTVRKRNPETLVVLDEAYYDYAVVQKDYPRALPGFVNKYSNVVVLRTFSKVYALAGLRVGFGVAGRGITETINRIRPPFNVNIIAQEAAVAALDDNAHVKRSVAMVEKGKKYFYSELRKLGLTFIPSAANFILVDVTPKLGRDVFVQLMKKGVIARAMDEYKYSGYIRITIGTDEQNRFAISKFKEIF
ncbi:MAG: histidinol-phosphate transaminase [Elusimicrobiota bacterium]